MKIIIFGGSFDPIHNGHIEIAKKAFKQIGANKLFFVPTRNVSYKNLEASGNQRLSMIKLAISNIDDFYIDDYELNVSISEYSYTIDLINYFKHKYPNDELYFLIGNDQLKSFHTWESYDKILSMCTLLVYQRDYKISKDLLAKYHAIEIYGKNINAASSQLVDLIINKQINQNILDYIFLNGLYYEAILKSYMDEKRYLHSVRVAKYAKNIMQIYNDKLVHHAWIAGLYHDICKCMDRQTLEYIAYEIMKIQKLPYKTLHGPVGAYYLNTVFNIKDKNIINAIMRHTLPFQFSNNDLSTLDKVIYCCDKLEPNRNEKDINNIEYFRNLIKIDIDRCFSELYESTNKQYNNDITNNAKILKYDIEINDNYSWKALSSLTEEKNIKKFIDDNFDKLKRSGLLHFFNNPEFDNIESFILVDAKNNINALSIIKSNNEFSELRICFDETININNNLVNVILTSLITNHLTDKNDNYFTIISQYDLINLLIGQQHNNFIITKSSELNDIVITNKKIIKNNVSWYEVTKLFNYLIDKSSLKIDINSYNIAISNINK